jgi:hypothetical protein
VGCVSENSRACAVNASTAEMDDGRPIDGDPKSHAGKRTVSFPADIVPELIDHLEQFTDTAPSALVLIGPKDGRLRRSNFRKFWHRAREAACPTSPRAALIYLHATRERDKKIAEDMGKLFADATRTRKTRAAKSGTSRNRSGTRRACGPERAS